MRKALIEALTQMAILDPRIWLLTADVGYRVVEPFQLAHPDRFLNVGVREQALISVAAGLAREGCRPVTYTMCAFYLRALEQVRNEIAYPGLPVLMLGVGAGKSYGQQGYSHWGIEDESAMRALRQLRVGTYTKHLTALRALRRALEGRNPVYMRVP
jgi:transketolase